MKEPWTSKVKCFIRRIIKKVCGHPYSCCSKIFYPCRKCRYVIEEQEVADDISERNSR